MTWSFKTDSMCTWANLEQVFTEEECDGIVQTFKEKKLRKGSLKNSEIDISIRDSNIYFFGPEEVEYVYAKLTDAIVTLNNNYFHFDLFGFNEKIQFTEYNAPTGKYDYHADILFGKSVRKLSVVVQLSDENEYEGGNLEIFGLNKPMLRKKGSVIVFPSFVVHRVTPLTKGTRYSLVGWINGPDFR